MSAVVSQFVDMVPNLPASPLDAYRKRASFEWKSMRLAIEHPELLKIKMRVWSIFESDPIYFPPKMPLTTEEEKRLTAKQLVKFLFSGLFEGIHNMSYQQKTQYLMTINEATEMFNPNLSIKFALGISLFSNALLCLGTERHLPYYYDVWSGKILSCLAVTELAHGSDTKRLKTTATYDHSTQEFIINSPGIEAAKCWVGNLGKQCTHALLFAQLVCSGVCHGLHGFIVPVRDPKTLLPYDNITVGDLGEKSGLHGIDNGFIMFHNYRIPRENLLNKTGDINDEGEYETEFSDPQRILGAALESLSAGRVAIMQESCNSISKAVVISVRYAAQRCQFSDSNGIELPIIEYQTHQWRLFPYVAAAYAIKSFVQKFSDQYIGCVAQSRDGQMDVDQTSLMVSGVHAIVCCSKALITWICRDAIQESREACGGHGYHKAAQLGDLRNNHDPRVTFEGDNTVLLQQTTNWLLRCISVNGNYFSFFPLSCIQYVQNSKQILGRRFNGSQLEHVISHSFITQTYEWLMCWLLKATSERIEGLKTQEEDKFKIRNRSQVFKGRSLALAFAESNILMYFWDHCSACDEELAFVLRKLYYLFGLWSLYKHIALLYQGGYSNSPALSELISEGILVLCSQLKPEVVSLVDAIAPPDFILKSALGASDGKVYEKLMSAFKLNNSSPRPYWWHEIVGKSKL